jgi:putative hydrolase of the HAD superfamily
MGPLPPKRIVFFDVGGTLVDVSPSVGHVYARACAGRGADVEPAAVQHAFDSAWVALSKEVPRGANRYRLFPGGEREWWDRVSCFALDLCGVPARQRPSTDELRAVFARPEAWRVFPEAREVLGELGRRGVRLGVISNWDSRLPHLLASLDLDAHFEIVVYSASAGYEKPHPGIFAAALEAAGVDPPNAMHIGDRLDEDYAGARAAGLNALLLSRTCPDPALMEEVSRCVDAGDLIADLREVLPRLDG